MDANLTKLIAIIGQADWAQFTGETGAVEWNKERGELTLKPEVFKFVAGHTDREPNLGSSQDIRSSDRRGAARDRFENGYFISPERDRIQVISASTGKTTLFWSCDQLPVVCEPGARFQPDPDPVAPDETFLSGLAVTEDHHLVIGAIGEKTSGILLFDLYSGGPPRHFAFPIRAAFVPFDITSRRGGGVSILDRKNKRVWQLDRHFRLMHERTEWPLTREFAPDDTRCISSQVRHEPVFDLPLPLTDPIAIEALPDGRNLILDAPPVGPSSVWIYRSGTPLAKLPVFEGSSDADLGRAYDFAFIPAANSQRQCSCSDRGAGVTSEQKKVKPLGSLFVLTAHGNQALRLKLTRQNGNLSLSLTPEFYPMRLFTGMGLMAGAQRAFYDSQGRWTPLAIQERMKYVRSAAIESRPYDGKEPGCIWHRILLDGCLPPETTVHVQTRASDERSNLDLDLLPWNEEPDLYKRSDDSELPFAEKPASPQAGTFETLFQHTRGRYLQLRLTLVSNGSSTPRLRAVRVYYPRFSYLERYLPAVYQQDHESASFLDRFLANLEGTNTAIEDKIAAVQMLFDVRSAPAETLPWLARWLGIAFKAAWDEPRRRLMIKHAMEFFRWRGTIRGLQMALHLAFDDCVGDWIFSAEQVPGPKTRATTPERFRIAEAFRVRPAPAIPFREPASGSAQQPDRNSRWTPDYGGAELRRRFAALPDNKNWSPFDLGAVSDTAEQAARTAFALRELGFQPSETAADRNAWQAFLQTRYQNRIGTLNDAHHAQWQSFNAIPLPADQPQDSTAANDWRAFNSLEAATDEAIKRARWQDFLARRYSGIKTLNDKYGSHWESFSVIRFPESLPANPWQLWDWYQFESVILPSAQSAHLFTALLPFSGNTLQAVSDRLARLALAKELLEAEKPAHTVFDVKFYWAFFRLGEARLNFDTVLGLGGRDPALAPPAILGETFLAEARLGGSSSMNARCRQIIGRDRLTFRSRNPHEDD